MSKIKRSSIQNDPCISSINLLRQRCESFFLENIQFNSTCRVYIDDPSEKKLGSYNDEIVDFILFGNAFKKFFESGNWIGERVRIWVLSQSNKRIIESYMNGAAKVNVIPRNVLFPLQKKAITFESGKEYNFIFAGRLSAQKNIESLLFFIKNYNETYSTNSKLKLFGDFEDTYHEDLGRRFQDSYQNRINTLIELLGISQNVIFHGKVDRETWSKEDAHRSVFITLSTFISEDFGCAVAEAQQAGWPIILSEFGGHLDVSGNNLIKIPVSFICNSHYPLELNSIVSECMIKKFESFLNQKFCSKENIELHELSLNVLDQHRRKYAYKLGANLSLIHSDYIGAFADTPQGGSFFHNIKGYMKPLRPYIVVLMYDLDEEVLSESQIESLHRIFDKIDLLKVDIEYVSSKNLFYKDIMKIILESQSIYIVKDRLNEAELDNYLRNTLQLSSSSIDYE
ncbi:glycosyltransferase [Halobacteriovorax sp.]|uniref:glycosyltransferase n=1 Tax=Halobacteriovorax sp. TaxID=2020862 RepID=UPI003566E1F5